jgi:cytochrome c biogenesis protein CcmG/thiol:disulfide interchange protein DsbE
MERLIKKILILSAVGFCVTVLYFALNVDHTYNTKSLINKTIPKFQFKQLNQDELIENNNLNKNFALINFWASWCTPCKIEHKYLMELKESLGDEVLLLGINFKDKKENANNFLTTLGNPYHFVGTDRDGKGSVDFGIYGIPETILVDQNQIILLKFIGPLSEDDTIKIKNKINE